MRLSSVRKMKANRRSADVARTVPQQPKYTEHGMAVWVWDGSWWPATVTRALVHRGELLLIVRFEHGLTAPARPASLEPRDPDLGGADKPCRFAYAISQRQKHQPLRNLALRPQSADPEKLEMSAKGKISLRQWVLTIVILCMSVWSAPAETLAQQATSPALGMTEVSTLWSFDGGGSNQTPYRVLGMADRGDTPFYRLGTAGSEATNPPAENAITRRNSPAMNHTNAVVSSPSVLSSFFDSNIGLESLRNSSAKPTAPGSFIYAYQPNYLAPEQRLANEESSTHVILQPPRPFFELEIGNWHLPVKLSGAESQDSSPHRW